jgi:hypothetical protein
MTTHMEFPQLPLSAWRPTRDSLHGYARVLGRIRRALMPPQKHWWHITLSVSARGLTTTPMPAGRGSIELMLNAVKGCIEIAGSAGTERALSVAGRSAKGLNDALEQELAALDVKLPAPNAAFDETVHEYDAAAASRYAAALTSVDLAFKQFKGTLREESGPVHLFPHHFDLSVNWFSGRIVPNTDPADAETADEQMNFGFVTGDQSIEGAYFYATAYPVPDELTSAALPGDAYWHTEGFTSAVLRYDTIAGSPDAYARLLEFLTAAQRIGAERMR